MSRTKAYVNGKHGRYHRVFLIAGGRVVKERSTNMYLKYGWSQIAAFEH